MAHSEADVAKGACQKEQLQPTSKATFAGFVNKCLKD